MVTALAVFVILFATWRLAALDDVPNWLGRGLVVVADTLLVGWIVATIAVVGLLVDGHFATRPQAIATIASVSLGFLALIWHLMMQNTRLVRSTMAMTFTDLLLP